MPEWRSTRPVGNSFGHEGPEGSGKSYEMFEIIASFLGSALGRHCLLFCHGDELILQALVPTASCSVRVVFVATKLPRCSPTPILPIGVMVRPRPISLVGSCGSCRRPQLQFLAGLGSGGKCLSWCQCDVSRETWAEWWPWIYGHGTAAGTHAGSPLVYRPAGLRPIHPSSCMATFPH